VVTAFIQVVVAVTETITTTTTIIIIIKINSHIGLIFVCVLQNATPSHSAEHATHTG
jgi:hypothetical protein